MPITSTNVVDGPDTQVSGQVRGVIEFTFHNGDTIKRNVSAGSLTEFNALPLALTPEVEAFMANTEIESHKDILEENLDPYFNDMGGWFEKKTDFIHTTWDDSFNENIKYYLSLDDRQELLHIKETIDRIPNTDLKNAINISQEQATQIRSDIQIAVDTKASLDLYAPLFDEDGVLI